MRVHMVNQALRRLNGDAPSIRCQGGTLQIYSLEPFTLPASCEVFLFLVDTRFCSLEDLAATELLDATLDLAATTTCDHGILAARSISLAALAETPDQHRALVYVVEPEQDPANRRFTRSRRPDNRKHASRRHLE